VSCACSSCGSAFRDTAPEEPEAEQPLPPKQALPPRVQPNSIIQCPRALREDSSSCLSDDRREVWYGGGSESGIREARGERRRGTDEFVRQARSRTTATVSGEEGGPDRLSQRIDEDGSAGDWEVLGFVEELEMYSILLSSLFTTHPAAPVIRSFSSFPQGGPSTPKQNTKKERKKRHTKVRIRKVEITLDNVYILLSTLTAQARTRLTVVLPFKLKIPIS